MAANRSTPPTAPHLNPNSRSTSLVIIALKEDIKKEFYASGSLRLRIIKIATILETLLISRASFGPFKL